VLKAKHGHEREVDAGGKGGLLRRGNAVDRRASEMTKKWLPLARTRAMRPAWPCCGRTSITAWRTRQQVLYGHTASMWFIIELVSQKWKMLSSRFAKHAARAARISSVSPWHL
jgi:hypothetical protein